eukprot:1138894-Pelagomonas_calceolata.AAC.1
MGLSHCGKETLPHCETKSCMLGIEREKRRLAQGAAAGPNATIFYFRGCSSQKRYLEPSGVDAGMTTDTSSYGADGQDEQGGLPEEFEVRIY